MMVVSLLSACNGATSEPFATFEVSGSVRFVSGTPVPNASVVVQTFGDACGVSALIHHGTATTNSQGAFRLQLGSGFDGCIRAIATVSDERSAFVVREGVRAAGGDTITQLNVTISD